MKNIIKHLIEKKQTISVMESCTGGVVANSITDIEGASSVFHFGAVTYSNAYKIKLGVDPDLIERYSVYSPEVAKEMSEKISVYADSDLGVGVTGKLGCADDQNPFGENDSVYICIYSRSAGTYLEKMVKVTKNSRKENKKLVLDEIKRLLQKILETN